MESDGKRSKERRRATRERGKKITSPLYLSLRIPFFASREERKRVNEGSITGRERVTEQRKKKKRGGQEKERTVQQSRVIGSEPLVYVG